MGITKLTDLIRVAAPGAISHKDISDYAGKVIAVDTSIIMNQFRTATPKLQSDPMAGIFFRTLTFLEHDIKPVFVFEGKPPAEKLAVLEMRAKKAGWSSLNLDGTESLQTKKCLQLLKLLGVPIIQAPGDGEAMCARLVSDGTADAVASEDMDTLPFGGGVLICKLKAKIKSDEYSLPKILEILKISQEEFVDLCILLGCDYCDKIAGLGPTKALKLIQDHRTIEQVVLHINKKTHPVPHLWQYQKARKLFLEGPRTVAQDLVWTEPDEEALVQFLCHTMHVKKARVRRRMEKFRQTQEKKKKKRQEEAEKEAEKEAGVCRQTRMEDFFRVTRKRKKLSQGDEAAPSKARKKTK